MEWKTKSYVYILGENVLQSAGYDDKQKDFISLNPSHLFIPVELWHLQHHQMVLPHF